jgi:hypothetical protein
MCVPQKRKRIIIIMKMMAIMEMMINCMEPGTSSEVTIVQPLENIPSYFGTR